MTYTQDFVVEEKEIGESNGVVLFGYTLTPKLTGIGCAIMGLAGAIYIFMTMVMPIREEVASLQSQQSDKQSQIDSLNPHNFTEQLEKLEEELETTGDINRRILSLFANEATIDTILLDINNFIVGSQAKLNSYQPGEAIEIVQDGSLGTLVDGKLKRQKFTLEIEGTFDQTQSVLRNLERLQSLVLVKDFSTSLKDSKRLAVYVPGQSQVFIPESSNILVTKFNLELLMPLNPEDAAALEEAAAADAETENSSASPEVTE